jgi:signal transduction histidine kinase
MVILAEARRLERLVRDLLDLAKLDARQFTFHIAPVDLNAAVPTYVDGFAREADDAGVEVSVELAPRPVVVAVDPDRLAQVLANLVENALKYARQRVTVTVEGGAPARLEVSDDGPGIAPEDLPHVFERLYVARRQPVRKESGSGLGLAIVRELVEAMGGQVQAVGRPGGGTRIVVTFPSAATAGEPGAPTRRT